MFMNANRIERLNRFILKALTKAIKAGMRIIDLYTGLGNKVEKLKKIIATLQEAVKKIEEMTEKEEVVAVEEAKIKYSEFTGEEIGGTNDD